MGPSHICCAACELPSPGFELDRHTLLWRGPRVVAGEPPSLGFELSRGALLGVRARETPGACAATHDGEGGPCMEPLCSVEAGAASEILVDGVPGTPEASGGPAEEAVPAIAWDGVDEGALGVRWGRVFGSVVGVVTPGEGHSVWPCGATIGTKTSTGSILHCFKVRP